MFLYLTNITNILLYCRLKTNAYIIVHSVNVERFFPWINGVSGLSPGFHRNAFLLREFYVQNACTVSD